LVIHNPLKSAGLAYLWPKFMKELHSIETPYYTPKCPKSQG